MLKKHPVVIGIAPFVVIRVKEVFLCKDEGRIEARMKADENRYRRGHGPEAVAGIG